MLGYVIMKKKLKLIIGALCTLTIVVGPFYFVHGVVGRTPPLRELTMYSVISLSSYIIGLTFKV